MSPACKFFGVFLAVLLLSTPSALGQDTKLIEAAKKEGGRIVVYGSIESETIDLIKKAFQKKTGLDVDYWRASSTKVMDRTLSEYRAGKPLFDVVLTIDNAMQIMQKEGIFAKYDSPTAKGFPKDATDPNLGPSYHNTPIGVLYHKGVMRPADAPKSLEDLVKPQYKGKLIMPDPTQHTTTIQWLVSLEKVMGKEKAEKFVRDLAATKPILVESLTPAGERVTTGEAPMAITFLKNVVIHGQKGVPLDYVRLGKFLGDGHYVSLSHKAVRANAGKAFIDFFLDEESMKLMASVGEFVNRKGIYPPLPDGDKVQLLDMVQLDKKGFAEKRKEYEKIFLR